MSNYEPGRNQDELEETNKIQDSVSVYSATSVDETTKRTHILEGNHADDDAHQVIVVTDRKILHAKNNKASKKSSQWMGAIDSASLQKLSSDLTSIALRKEEHNGA
jgi:hypothetical protein